MEMTPTQCRMARAALKWSQQQLADAAKVRQGTLSEYELGSDARSSTVRKLKVALESAGIVFVGQGEVSLSGGAGVRLNEGPAQ